MTSYCCIKHFQKRLYLPNHITRILPFLFLAWAMPTHAEIDWMSVTLDNDLFVGNDNGYMSQLPALSGQV
jgi:hypothetical protein